MRKQTGILLMLCALVLGACDDDEPTIEERPESELSFVRFDMANFPPAQREASVWAVQGQERQLTLRFESQEPNGGDAFLELDIPADALLNSPEGRPYEQGDSVEITVQLDPDGRFLFIFGPDGLEFDPASAPVLRLSYEQAAGDLDGDGDVDEDDEALRAQLRIWQQEQPGELWRALESDRLDGSVEAEIRSFTGFALAS